MSEAYDRALTVFSPDGHLLQVEYAAEAVQKGTCVAGIVGHDVVVIGVERRAAAKLQDPRTAKKIAHLDNTIVLAFSGLQADARVLVDMARLECQSYRLNTESEPSIDYIGRQIASIQQKYTIRGGRRPFGISTLIGGFSSSGLPRLLQTEPHGILTSWKAQAIGRNSKTVQEYFEKNIYGIPTYEEAFNLIVGAMFEVVEATQNFQNIEVIRLTKSGIFKASNEEISQAIKCLEKTKLTNIE